MFFGGGIPFAFGGGGMPFEAGGGGGGPSSRGRGSDKPVDNESYYKTLGVAKDASEAEIKKAFRKLAMKHHPDKGGDPEEFKKIGKIADVLSDPKKRQVYDAYGEEGLEGMNGGDGGGGGGAADLFSELFGGGGGRRRRDGGGAGGKRKGKDAMHPLDVSLEDLYNGRTVKLAVTRDAFCEGCSGSGAQAGSGESDCGPCRGSGMVTRIAQMGPGMITQMSSPCGACRGTGRVIPEDKKCLKCKGKKVTQERKVVEVHIERGMKHGSRVVFRGEAGDEPGAEPGDLIFVVQQKPHAVFKRDGNDLFIEREIPLVDALCGLQFTLTHLDKRRLRIASGKGEIIRPDSFKCVENAGMPIPGTGGMRFGDLYLKFSIVFPASGSLNNSSLNALRLALPAGPREKVSASNDKGSADGASSSSSSSSSSLKPGEIVEEVYGSKPAPTTAASFSSTGKAGGKGAKDSSSASSASSSSPRPGGKAGSKGGAGATMDVDGINIAADADGAAAAEHLPKAAHEGEVEEFVMSEVTAESRADRVKAQQAAAGHGSGEAYDEDEEEGGGARRVQCAQQ